MHSYFSNNPQNTYVTATELMIDQLHKLLHVNILLSHAWHCMCQSCLSFSTLCFVQEELCSFLNTSAQWFPSDNGIHTLTIEGCCKPLSRWMLTSFNTRCRTIGSFTNLSVILLTSIYTAFRWLGDRPSHTNYMHKPCKKPYHALCLLTTIWYF